MDRKCFPDTFDCHIRVFFGAVQPNILVNEYSLEWLCLLLSDRLGALVSHFGLFGLFGLFYAWVSISLVDRGDGTCNNSPMSSR